MFQLRHNIFKYDSKWSHSHDLSDRIVVHLDITITEVFFSLRAFFARSISSIFFFWNRPEARLEYHDQILVCMTMIFVMNQVCQRYDDFTEIIMDKMKIQHFQKYQKDSVENVSSYRL